jgi:hypothetical protein
MDTMEAALFPQTLGLEAEAVVAASMEVEQADGINCQSRTIYMELAVVDRRGQDF